MGHNGEKSYLDKHARSLERIAKKIFAKELARDFSKGKIPLLKFSICKKSSDFVYFYFLSRTNFFNKRKFIEKLILKLSFLKKEPNILSSRTAFLQLSEKKAPYFFHELFIELPGFNSAQNLKKELADLKKHIGMQIFEPPVKQRVKSKLDTHTFLYEWMVFLIRRYPLIFSYDCFHEIEFFLSQTSEEFRKARPQSHLARLIACHYFFRKKLAQDIHQCPNQRHFYLKLKKLKLYRKEGPKNVLGVSLALNALKDYECFELRHIQAAVKRLFSKGMIKSDSYYFHRLEEKPLSFFYFEIEKSKGKDFTPKEMALLKKELPVELKNSIEVLSPSLFIPRTEEEIIRNIISLADELRYMKDLPQVLISFQEQRLDTLKFNVILVRGLGSKAKPICELAKLLPAEVKFLPERVANVGLIRNKTIKEANIFSFVIENKHFLRKNHSVDLVKARQFVVKQLEKLIGNFKDFNGTFLLKQNRQLEAIKKELHAKGKPTEFLLEKVFYSLSAPALSKKLTTKQTKELSCMLLKSLESDLFSHLTHQIEIKEEKAGILFVLKTTVSEIKDNITNVLKNFGSELISSTIEHDPHYYICGMLFSSRKSKRMAFLACLQETIRLFGEKQGNSQTLTIHLPRAAQSLDPRTGYDRTSGIVLKMLYEGLMRINEKGEKEPAIAEEVKISKDWKKYHFKLKKTFWSNGSPLTAYDFEYAWKKVLEPDFRSPYSFLFFPIKNAESAKRGEIAVKDVGIKALNDDTLIVELEFPAKYFLELTASWAFSPLCREIDQKHPGWAYHSGSSHVCNGPFKLETWKLTDDLQVVKNPLYWDAQNVFLDRINMMIVEDEKKALDMFLKGQLDWIGDPITKIPPEFIAQLREKELIHYEKDYYGLFWIQLNVKKTPFQNATVRKALAYAIDRKKLIHQILRSEDTAAFGFFHPPKLSNADFPDGNKELAKKLFDEGLKELNLQLEDLPPILISHSEIEEQELIAKEIGKTWKELFGLNVKYEKLLWNAYFDKLNSDHFMLGGIAWNPRFEDAMYFFNLFVFRQEAVHVTNWKKADYIRLLEKAKETVDEEKKLSYLQECEKILQDEMPVIPLFYQKFRYLKNPKLSDYILSNINQIDFRKARLV